MRKMRALNNVWLAYMYRLSVWKVAHAFNKARIPTADKTYLRIVDQTLITRRICVIK